MFSLQQLNSMNYNKNYSSSSWIKNINEINNNQNNNPFKLYATNNCTISSGREYIALPANKKLTENDYIKYNILK
jgi:hypothetical protein